MKHPQFLVKTAAILLAAASSSMAAAPVYEGFDYTSGQNITTLPGGGTGFTGGWVTGGTGTNILTGTTDAMGLEFGSLVTTGGSLNVTSAGGNNWQFLARSLGITIADGETLYESFLFQYNGAGALGGGQNFGISVGDSAGADHTMGLLPRAYNSATTGRLGYSDATHVPLTYTTNITDGSVYMFIGKWTNLGGASTSAGWVLSLANFDAISGAPIDEAALDANNVAMITGAGTAGLFGTSQFIKIGDFIGDAINYKVDEVRFSNNLGDVVPVPEPGTVALLAIGGLGWVMLRRRKV